MKTNEIASKLGLSSAKIADVNAALDKAGVPAGLVPSDRLKAHFGGREPNDREWAGLRKKLVPTPAATTPPRTTDARDEAGSGHADRVFSPSEFALDCHDDDPAERRTPGDEGPPRSDEDEEGLSRVRRDIAREFPASPVRRPRGVPKAKVTVMLIVVALGAFILGGFIAGRFFFPATNGKETNTGTTTTSAAPADLSNYVLKTKFDEVSAAKAKAEAELASRPTPERVKELETELAEVRKLYDDFVEQIRKEKAGR